MTERRRAALVAALPLAAGLALAACAPKRGAEYETSLAAGRRAYTAGRFEEAASRYADAAREAKVPRDAVYMRYEAALARDRAGDRAGAAGELRAIAEAKPPNEYSASAALKLAEWTAATDPEAADRQLDAIVMAFPTDGVAIVAMLRLARHDDAIGGSDRAIVRLERFAKALEGVDDGRGTAEQTAVYERAKRIAAAVGRTEEARRAFLDIAARWPYPFGPYFDDALYRASEMSERLGRIEEAIAELERLLSYRETSAVVGTYERPRYVPALLRIADLYANKLHDHDKARSALHRLYTDFTTSTLRDDALFREAELWRADGDTKTACSRLEALADDFPDSRYVPCAIERCPSIKRPPKSRAPATCHAYIERGEEPGAPPP